MKGNETHVRPLSELYWPDNARIAVTITIAFELWQGAFVESGYHDGPPVNIPAALLESGYRDQATLSWQEYGGKRGMWRLLDIVDAHAIPVTTVISGLAAERYPDVSKAYADSGHELCAHSWAQDIRTWALNGDEEGENIRRCTDTIRDVTGYRPTGWISPSAQAGPRTASLLQEAGYVWHGDYADDDLPYVLSVNGDRMVAIPYQYDLNDLKIYIKGMNPPSVYVEWFRKKFDTLYREGEHEARMMNATVHASLYGRPFGSWVVDEVIRYAKGFPGVWFATRREIAECVIEQDTLRKSGHSI